MISSILAGFAAMASGDVACIIAIRMGEGQLYYGLKSLFILGFLAGIILFYFVIHRPIVKFNKLHEKELWSLLEDGMAIIRELKHRLYKHRVEGDEWKDNEG